MKKGSRTKSTGMSYDSMVVLFKLVTGETIITQILHEDNSFFIIKSPHKINIEYDREKKIRMMSETQWVSDLADENGVIFLAKHGVIGFGLVTEEHKKIYLDAVKFYESDNHEEDTDTTEEQDQLLKEINTPKTFH